MPDELITATELDTSVTDWLFKRVIQIKTGAYGEPDNVILIVNAEGGAFVSAFGSGNCTDLLRLMDRSRLQIKNSMPGAG